MAYSPDGESLAVESRRGEIVLWDVTTSIPIQEFTSQDEIEIFKDFAYSPDGKYLASAIDKKWPGSKTGSAKGFIDIWDTSTGTVKTLQWDSDRRIKGLSYSHDGKYLAVASDKYIKLYDAQEIRK